MSDKRTIPCPTCNAPTDYCAPPVGPFCSNRCQLVDLGKWFTEEYVFSEPLQPHHFEELDEQL